MRFAPLWQFLKEGTSSIEVNWCLLDLGAVAHFKHLHNLS